jgi:hypothetical protein
MKCNVNDEQLLDWFLGELSLDEQTMLNEHVKECQCCALQIKDLQQLNDAWEKANELPSDQFIDDVMRTIDDIKPHSKYRVNDRVLGFTHYITAVAATFLFMYIGGFDQMFGIMGEMSQRVNEVNGSMHMVTDVGFNWLNRVQTFMETILQPLKI